MVQNTWIRHISAWLLLLTVLAVCISPYVDLDDCTLSSRQDASFFCWLLAASLFLLVARMNFSLCPTSMQVAAVSRNSTWLPPDEDILPTLHTLRI